MAGIRRDQAGAEALEFAFVGPLLFLLVFGVIYALLAMAAQLSLNYAANVGVRFATIPVDAPANLYPTPQSVQSKVADSTPFFQADDCTTSVPPAGTPNEEFTLTVSCDFPNPAGRALRGLGGLFGGGGGGSDDAGTVTLTADAKGRRE
ncbi:MAG: pilus assembly protein [Actinomycetota bacterium]|nr:pilus assembly protein [Actinomycetota bacterium]